MRVVVLGAGFGGLELSTRLSQQFGDDLEIVLIDNTEHFVFGYSKLDVMFGKTLPQSVQHAYADIVQPGVRFVSADQFAEGQPATFEVTITKRSQIE